jgi:hypothetical protein
VIEVSDLRGALTALGLAPSGTRDRHPTD